jgi:hypothetical protein
MRAFWIGAVLLCAFVAPADAQAISPNDGRADEVILDQCERRWPTDFSMRAACIDIQQEARQKLQQTRAASDDYNRPLKRDGHDYD